MPRREFKKYYSKPILFKNLFLEYESEDRKGSVKTHEMQLMLQIKTYYDPDMSTFDYPANGLFFAIYGLGGMGKSIALQGLCYQDCLKDIFYDGIYYIHLGPHLTDETFIEKLAVMVEVFNVTYLRERMVHCKTIEAAVHMVLEVFEKKRVLFIVDDLCSSDDMQFKYLHAFQFLISNGNHSAMIISTQEKSIADEANESIHFDYKEMDRNYSSAILLRHAGIDCSEINNIVQGALDKITHECSGIKSCLAIAGSMLRDQVQKNSELDVSLAVQQLASLLRKKPVLLVRKQFQGYKPLESVVIETITKCERDVCPLIKDEMQDLNLRNIFELFGIFRRNGWIPVSVLCQLCSMKFVDMNLVLEAFSKYGLVEHGHREDSRSDSCGSQKAIRLSAMLSIISESFGKKSGYYKSWHVKMFNLLACFPSVKKFFPDRREQLKLLSLDSEENAAGADPGILNDVDISPAYITDNLINHIGEGGLLTELRDLLTNMNWITIRKWEKLKRDFITAVRIFSSARNEMSTGDIFEESLKDIQSLSHLFTNSSFRLRKNRHQLLFEIYRKWVNTNTKLVPRYIQNIESTINCPWLKPLSKVQGPSDRRERYTLETMSRNISCITYQKGLMGMALESGEIIVFNIETQEKKVFKVRNEGYILSITISNNGRFLAVGSFTGYLQIWDLKHGRIVEKPFEAHRDSIRCIQFSNDDKRVASGSSDKSARVWDVRTRTMVAKPLVGHERKVECLTFCSNGDKLVTGSWDGTLRLWDLNDGSQIGSSCYIENFTWTSLALNMDETLVVAGSWCGKVYIWNLITREEIQQCEICESGWPIPSLVFSNDSKRIIAGTYDGKIYCYDIDQGSLACEPWYGHKDWVMQASFAENETQIISVSKDGVLKKWSFSKTGYATCLSQGHLGWVWALAISADGKLIASGSADNTILLWDTDTGMRFGSPLIGHSARIRFLEFSADSRRVISTSNDDTILHWDVNSCSQLHKQLDVRDLGCQKESSTDNICTHGIDDKWIRTFRRKSKDIQGNYPETDDIITALEPALEDLGVKIRCKTKRNSRKRTRTPDLSSDPRMKIECINDSVECIFDNGSRISLASIPRVTCSVVNEESKTIGLGTQDGQVIILKLVLPIVEHRKQNLYHELIQTASARSEDDEDENVIRISHAEEETT